MILDELARLLGDEAITAVGERDLDPRSAEHVSGRAVGRPLGWVRPRDAQAAAIVVERARAAGVRVVPVGAATAYWDPLRLDGAIALDTLALRAPFAIDAVARVAHVGAGHSLRDVDRAARRHGLCLAARPDSGGDTPVGALLAVASTAGLGLGRAQPIALVCAATVVTGTGALARLGASYALHGVPFARHGAPDALGLVAGAQGRGALVTDVGLLLHRAPFIVTLRACAGSSQPSLIELAEHARRALDDGAVETVRLERGERLELMARTASPRHAGEALAAARALADEWRVLRLSVAPPDIEPEPARRGEPAHDDYHWLFPVAEHRARLLGGAFWGIDVSINWRALEPCLARLEQLWRDLGELPLLTRRLGVYPGTHEVNLGVQWIAPRAQADAIVARVSPSLTELLALGALPYRPGHLWREALARHGGASLATEMLGALDPDGVLGGVP